jgi:hypothetical protein
MSSTLFLHETPIPYSWKSELYVALRKLLTLERTREAFAQIFEGVQTQHSAIMMGDFDSTNELELKLSLSDEAKKHADCWLSPTENVMNNVVLDYATTYQASSILNSDASIAEKNWVLLHDLIKPAFNSCLRRYLLSCKDEGGSLQPGSFYQIYCPKRPAWEMVQDWVEEFVFGGKLSASPDKTKVCL